MTLKLYVVSSRDIRRFESLWFKETPESYNVLVIIVSARMVLGTSLWGKVLRRKLTGIVFLFVSAKRRLP